MNTLADSCRSLIEPEKSWFVAVSCAGTYKSHTCSTSKTSQHPTGTVSVSVDTKNPKVKCPRNTSQLRREGNGETGPPPAPPRQPRRRPRGGVSHAHAHMRVHHMRSREDVHIQQPTYYPCRLAVVTRMPHPFLAREQLTHARLEVDTQSAALS